MSVSSEAQKPTETELHEEFYRKNFGQIRGLRIYLPEEVGRMRGHC
jgi:hypothetical protein